MSYSPVTTNGVLVTGQLSPVTTGQLEYVQLGGFATIDLQPILTALLDSSNEELSATIDITSPGWEPRYAKVDPQDETGVEFYE